MDIDLDEIAPETPTEFILKEYARKLERLVKEARMDAGRDPRFVISPRTEMVVDASVIDRYWYDGIAMCGVCPHEGGHMMKVISKPIDGSDSFQVAIFINREVMPTKTQTANVMGELYKQGIHRIADIYTRKK